MSLGVPRSRRHPTGAYDEAGRPLCHEHRRTRCHRCGSLHPYKNLARREVGIRKDTHLRDGKTPRMEPVIELFCPACLERDPSTRPPTWLLPTLLVSAIAVAVVLAVLLRPW